MQTDGHWIENLTVTAVREEVQITTGKMGSIYQARTTGFLFVPYYTHRNIIKNARGFEGYFCSLMKVWNFY